MAHAVPDGVMLGAFLIAVTAGSFVWLGYEIAARSPRAPGFTPIERIHAAVAGGAALWIASVWLAALVHQLDRVSMLVRTALAVAAALIAFFIRTRGRAGAREVAATVVWSLMPVALWIAFIGWRSGIVPPLSHDALAYHLPRAVLWIREHAFTYIDLPIDARVRLLPANYEMLVADAMLLGNGDAWTEWVALFFYVAFLVAAASLADRWFPRCREAVLAVVLISASVPVLLLHAGADKNDVMTAFFMVSALSWAGKWMSEGDVFSLVLCGVTTIAAVGTKPQGLILGAALLPIVLWRLVREWRSGEMRASTILRIAGITIVAATLLGGVFYATRMVHESADAAAERRAFVGYGDWQNLWQAPWVLLTAPFSRTDRALFMPGDGRWFWRRYEIYFSHLGVPFAVCALLLPFALWGFRRDAADRLRERIAIAAAALATLLLMLPVRDVPMPRGIYTIALPRYVLFIVPVVFSLTVAPAVARLARSQRRFATIAVAIFAAWFVREAVDAMLNDVFVPLEYVAVAREHPGIRVIPFDPFRAASIVDRLAGPHDAIDFDAGYSAWIYPAFGSDLTRRVRFLDQQRPVVSPDAKWVVVDRSFNIIWGHMRGHDLSDWRLIARGQPTQRDTELVRRLRADPRFQLMYLNRRTNQAVFRRIR